MTHIIAENHTLGRAVKNLLANRPNQKARVYSTENSLRGVSIKPNDELIVFLVSDKKRRELLPVLDVCRLCSL